MKMRGFTITEKKKKYPASRLAGLKPPWQAGETGNAGGRPRQDREMVMKLRANADFFTGAMIGLVERANRGEQLSQSDRILSQHLEFIWKAMFGNHAQAVLFGGEIGIGDISPSTEGGGLTALLQRARAENARREAKFAPPPRKA